MKKTVLTILACVIPAGLCARPPERRDAQAPEKPAVKAPGKSTRNGARVVLPKEDASSRFMPSELVRAAGIFPDTIQAGGFLVGKKHKVTRGDTLWDLSGKYYKDPFLWGRIYNANFNTVADPDRIKPKEELIIPDVNEILVPYRRAAAAASESVAAEEGGVPGLAAIPAVPGSRAGAGGASAAGKKAMPGPGGFSPDPDLYLLSEEMPEDQKEWTDGMKIVPDDWLEDGEITARSEDGDSDMDGGFSSAGENVEILMSGPGLVKPGDFLVVYLKGGDAYNKSGEKLGRELQPAGLVEIYGVEGLVANALVVEATTAISKGYLVKRK